MAPRIGERSAITMLPMELARPNRNVVIVASAPSLQYCFRNSGKNADITVIANAEFAQSYSAQDMTFRRSSISRFRCPGQLLQWRWEGGHGRPLAPDLLRLDLREPYVLAPILAFRSDKRRHGFGCARERIGGDILEKLAGLLARRDLVEPGGELVDDSLGRARRNDDSKPGSQVVARKARLRHGGDLRQHAQARRRGEREQAHAAGSRLRHE